MNNFFSFLFFITSLNSPSLWNIYKTALMVNNTFSFITISLIITLCFPFQQNQVANLKQKRIEANFLNSTQTNKEAIMNDLLKKTPQTKLLYITPEMITLSSNAIKSLKSLYARNLLSMIVVDEAHCISTWGHDFRSSYRKLSMLRSIFPKTPIMVQTNKRKKFIILFKFHSLIIGINCDGNQEVLIATTKSFS